MNKNFKIVIEFSNDENLRRDILAKNREEAFALLFETSNDGWLIEANNERDIYYNLNNAISITIIDEEKNNKKYDEYTNSFLKK